MPRIREHLIEEKTRHGKIRHLFHRRPDGRRITVKGKPGEVEFENRYQWLVNGGDQILDLEKSAVERQRSGSAPLTVHELGSHYRTFVDKEHGRSALSSYTIQHYGRFTDRFIRDFGPVHLDTITPHQLERILDGWSGTDNAWNNALRAIKHFFKYARVHWGLKPNPAEEIEKRKVVTNGFEPWEHEDINQFFKTHPLGSTAHLAMMLLLNAAPRRSDLVRLGPTNIIHIDGLPHLKFVPQKTEHTSAIPVTIPISDELQAAFDKTTTGDDTFLITEYGHPFTAEGFGNKLASWRDAAGVRSCVATHGLRKSVGIDMAENDATPYEIMAALGHSSPKVTKVYTEAADRRKLSSKASKKANLTKLALQSQVNPEGGTQ
ncbi:tyrosine-type recombinase/integrase [uncultured Tateyamaria sp.]|uniref:tyrosine-type recombinase/integrase n=1 Tax=uncultured Tateyamaria sp. TaxID=455651 RepID=UPI00260260D1|nr:tyrosine-type recombinase/integrase [uncultured Tateyamaria sp.]